MPLLPAWSQPHPFGSADDPREQIQQVWWKRESTLDVMGGFSLIGAQWRTAGNATANIVTKSFTGRLHQTIRTGIYGLYERDFNEPYDLLRSIDFIRYNPPANVPFYLRVGPLKRVRLGPGHLVNFYNTYSAWDDRTIGAEMRFEVPLFSLTAFTGNLLLNNPTGARIGFKPLYRVRNPRTQSFTVGLSYVTDLGTRTEDTPDVTAYNVDIGFDALSSGSISLTPFASFAWYENHGAGLGIGAMLDSPNFIDLMRFNLRMALFYNGRDFIPGYIGSFYSVSNIRARIVDSERYFNEGGQDRLQGVTLERALGGNDLVTELRMLFFQRFEFWYYFRRHYGTQALSEYHLRLFLNVPNKLQMNTGIDRAGLSGFFSLFSAIEDQTSLVFETSYNVTGPFWAHITARYTFERLGDAEDGTPRYLVQRRFEPFVGVRFTF